MPKSKKTGSPTEQVGSAAAAAAVASIAGGVSAVVGLVMSIDPEVRAKIAGVSMDVAERMIIKIVARAGKRCSSKQARAAVKRIRLMGAYAVRDVLFTPPPRGGATLHAGVLGKVNGPDHGVLVRAGSRNAGPPTNRAIGADFARPSMSSRTVNGVLVTSVVGRDYVGELVSATGFNVQSFRTNPGLPALFPWLSRIAEAYEQYRFKRLRFVVQTLAPTSSAGEVAMYMDYDSEDPVPESMRDFLTNSFAKTGPVWERQLVYDAAAVPMNASNLRYVRVGTPANSDYLWRDVGIMHVAFDNIDVTPGDTFARLFVDYDIELMVPHTDALELAQSHSYVAKTESASKSNVFNGLAEVGDGTLAQSLTLTGGDPATIVFNLPGFYQVTGTFEGSGMVGNIVWAAGTDTSISEVAAIAAGACETTVQMVHVLEPGGSITIDASATTATDECMLTIARGISNLSPTHNVSEVGDSGHFFHKERQSLEPGLHQAPPDRDVDVTSRASRATRGSTAREWQIIRR